ncbi:MAG: hypothetical protein PHP23_06905 [Desulfobacterales bacterium]|nr:hypothetical protein [Desulfobacterales bacterium]MDD4073728.1 hypothetical protein [Desulfobacterales bacterium]MDD4392783.1 hypothetical protein [Desulfobacterales bacterium]
MNAATRVQIIENLKFLKMAAIKSELENQLRQASESNIDYEQFLLDLTEIEVCSRLENGRKRRLRDAKFSQL